MKERIHLVDIVQQEHVRDTQKPESTWNINNESREKVFAVMGPKPIQLFRGTVRQGMFSPLPFVA